MFGRRHSVCSGAMCLGLLVCGALLPACGGGSGTPDEAGGTGGSTGGTAGTGATGGSSGTGGGSGSAGTGGDTCGACTVSACTTNTPPTDVITDFSNLYFPDDDPMGGIFGIQDDTGNLLPDWWTGYFAGSFAYPGEPDACSSDPPPSTMVTRDTTGGSMHVTGTVGTYAGFGVWFGQCLVDMSAYSGISFRLGGNAGSSGQLKFTVSTTDDAEIDSCRPGRGTCDATAITCAPNNVMIDVPASAAVVTVPFSDLMGGTPATPVNAAAVAGLQWEFAWADGDSSYAVDLTLDDVTMVQ